MDSSCCPRCAGATSARASSSCSSALAASAGACSSSSRRRRARTNRGSRGARGTSPASPCRSSRPARRQPLYNAAIELSAGRAPRSRRPARAPRRMRAPARRRARDRWCWSPTSTPPSALSRLGPRLVFYDFNDHPVSVRRGARRGPRATGSAGPGAVRRRLRGLRVLPPAARRAQTTAPVVLLGNGVEYARFATPRGAAAPALAALPRPRIGYIGQAVALPRLRRARATGRGAAAARW